ncbi:MAG TPA: hypothetical protein V6D08_18030 [Candidatus Obscuribacterales bacterium]
MITPLRRQRGNTLFVMAVTVSVFFMPALMLVGQTCLLLAHRQRAQSTIEAASLLAANDLSRIVINDPHFGWVSLSNHPPVGNATCAPDGEPLPVTGINTLVGTIRHNSILARELRNSTLQALAAADRAFLRTTIENLNAALAASLTGFHDGAATDIHGDVVDPVADVTAFLEANLPNNMRLESVKLSTGWLAGGGTTTIPVPQPQQLAMLQEGDAQGGNYKAFVEVPVDGNFFTFAGIGSSSTLVDPSGFQEADDEHVCSIVRLECAVVLKERAWLSPGDPTGTKLLCVSCSQPYSQPDLAPKGALTLRLSGGTVPGLQSWSDLLRSDNFRDNQLITYDVVGGDYPFEPDAQMKQRQPDRPSNTAHQFAEHLYCWLRNGHVRPRLDALLKMIREPFPPGTNQVIVYEFTDEGAISRKILAGDLFPPGVTADAQRTAVADTTVPGGTAPVIIFRNNVYDIGTASGGKHCGQPLAGYPLDEHELRARKNEQQLALGFGRRSICNRGLAVDIEIGGIRTNAPAEMDSKRAILQARRI